jgi:AraC-like DNA-binding protein
MVNIQVIKPLSGLEQYIDCYSFCLLKGSVEQTRMKTIANSCTTLFIYLNGSKHNGIFNNKRVNISYGIISPFSLRNDSLWMLPDVNQIKCVTVMFTSYGFHKLFGIPMKHLYGSIMDVAELDLPGLKETILRIEEAKDDQSITSILNAYFIKQYTAFDIPNSRYQYTQRIISYIISQKGMLTVRELCDYTSTTERTLENWFKTFVGASPRDFIQIIKFKNMLGEIFNSESEYLDWHTLLYKYRYYDQAHMINTFRDATSVSPDYFQKNKKTKLFLASNGSGCLFFADSNVSNLLHENQLQSSVNQA